MPLVRDSRERFAGLLNDAARSLDLDPSLVEKDYWAVEALRAIRDGFDATVNDATVHLQPIFKGGTSLSKAFGLIERFSEDVDLLVPVPFDSVDGYSQSQRADVMKACTEAVSAALAIEGERSGGRKGVDRHWRYPYTPTVGDPALLGVEPLVRVELTVMGGSNPHSVRSVTSMAADRAKTIDGFPVYDDLSPVEIETLAAERTLVEKLAMLHDAAHQALDGKPARFAGAGRHFYDIAQLLDSAEVRAALSPAWVAEIAADADRWSDKGNFPSTPRPADGFATSPAFTDATLADIVQVSFDLAMRWVWSPTKPSLADCIAKVQAHAALL
jgi:hypothetical protein